MRALLSAEVRRYLARRLVKVAVGLAVLGILLAGTVVFIKSHRLHPGRVAVLQSGLDDPRFHLVSLRDVYLGTDGILIALFMLLAASFVGAEWHAGTMTTLLTWDPRRPRVFAAKVAVAATMAFIGLVLLQVLLGAALAPAAIVRGTTDGADVAWFRSVGGALLRAGGVAALIAAIGCAVAWIGRSTAAALGVVFGYIAVVEPLLHAVRPKWQPWFLVDNAATVVQGHSITFPPRSPGGAVAVLAGYAAALLLVSGVLFVRRDVT